MLRMPPSPASGERRCAQHTGNFVMRSAARISGFELARIWSSDPHDPRQTMTLAPPSPLESSAASRATPRRVIDIADLSLTYETDDGPVHALSNIDLAIEAGQCGSLRGPPGWGETTLVPV